MQIKKYLKALLYFLIPFLALLLITTVFYYFDIINNQTMKYIKLFIILFSCFLGGLQIGKTSTKKGYINGIILGSIIVFIFFIISLFLKNAKLSRIIYYFIIVITTTISSMIGINKKK